MKNRSKLNSVLDEWIIGKILKGLGSVILIMGLVIWGIIFIVAPGLAAALGCSFLEAAEY